MVVLVVLLAIIVVVIGRRLSFAVSHAFASAVFIIRNEQQTNQKHHRCLPHCTVSPSSHREWTATAAKLVINVIARVLAVPPMTVAVTFLAASRFFLRRGEWALLDFCCCHCCCHGLFRASPCSSFSFEKCC